MCPTIGDVCPTIRDTVIGVLFYSVIVAANHARTSQVIHEGALLLRRICPMMCMLVTA